MKIKSKLNSSDYASIAKLFSPIYIDYFANNQFKEISNLVELFKYYISFENDFTILDAYDSIYKVLEKKYKNEYVFKNKIFKKLVLSNHDMFSCVAIPEFNVESSKADLAVFNGTSTVYEIKSEIDTTDRLSSQLNDYNSFFEHVNIVISEKHLEKVKKIITENVGVFILSQDNKIIKDRDSKSNIGNITHRALFYSLRKPEYLYIIKSKYGFEPCIPNTLIFEYCFDLFKKIDISEAHMLTLQALKHRLLKKEQIDLIKILPDSLKTISLTKRYNRIKCENILQNIQKTYS